MAKRGIGIGVHYPAIHRFALYRAMGYGDGDFPVAERVGRGIVTLPLFPAMQDSDVDRVCMAAAETIGEFRNKCSVMEPELSIVVPVYNEEEGLPQLFGRLYPAARCRRPRL